MINGWILMAASYLLGAIPFGLIVAKSMGIDILKEGSGNIGATNVGRTLGKKAGIFVLVLDVLKSFLPAWGAKYLVATPTPFNVSLAEFGLICGGLAMVGHMASPFLKFKGGKGIASGLGMLVGSAWPVGLTVLASFAVFMVFTRIVSLSSLVGVTAMVVSGFFFKESNSPLFWIVYTLLAIFIFWKHRPNIQRLLKGEEKKFSFASKKSEAAVESADQS
ncbi:MAG: glycerol-3-phosphate 1-O-acyltransferase PlsY [Fimbriimonadaceae bacterium]|nr:glycerol-3-phosphate 1-O-acyltransferase PlsY [Fimbriimonadaceae bacterium]